MFNSEIIHDPKNPRTIRLIGDVLCDRGENDYFTLLILEKLIRHKVPLEIMLSNHDAVFLKKYADNFSKFRELFSNNSISCDRSYRKMKFLMDKGFIKKSEVDRLVQRCILPSLRLISYTTEGEGQEKSLHLFFHTPLGVEIIRELAEHYKVPYQNEPIEAMCATIDAINDRFSARISEGNAIFSEIAKEVSQKVGVHYKLLWSRRDPKEDEPFYQPELPETLGTGVQKYSLFYNHGHDGPAPNKDPHQNNLDTDVGKGPIIAGLLLVHASWGKGRGLNSFFYRSLELCREYQKHLLMPYLINFKANQNNLENEADIFEDFYQALKIKRNHDRLIPKDPDKHFERAIFLKKFEAFSKVKEQILSLQMEKPKIEQDFDRQVHDKTVLKLVAKKAKIETRRFNQHRSFIAPNSPEIITLMVFATIVTGILPGILTILAFSLRSYVIRGSFAFHKTHGQLFAENLIRMAKDEDKAYQRLLPL